MNQVAQLASGDRTRHVGKIKETAFSWAFSNNSYLSLSGKTVRSAEKKWQIPWAVGKLEQMMNVPFPMMALDSLVSVEILWKTPQIFQLRLQTTPVGQKAGTPRISVQFPLGTILGHSTRLHTLNIPLLCTPEFSHTNVVFYYFFHTIYLIILLSPLQHLPDLPYRPTHPSSCSFALSQ